MESIIILTGSGTPAISAANIYNRKIKKHYKLIFIEEKNLTYSRIKSLIFKKIKKQGIFSGINFLLYGLCRLFIFKTSKIKKEYTVNYSVDNINSFFVKNIIQEQKPNFLIGNACSIIKQDLLSIVSCPILNLHNGITPRYRGIGNIWTFYENNPLMAGVTIHFLDTTIDDGQRISVQYLDFSKYNIDFYDIDICAFQHGADMIVTYILNKIKNIPDEYRFLLNRYYSYPGLTHYLIAKKNYKRFIKNHIDTEKIWKKSFTDYAENTDKKYYARMHWGNVKSVKIRDSMIKKVYDELDIKKKYIIDVGCGDGRYSDLLESDYYIGSDYIFNMINTQNNDAIIEQQMFPIFNENIHNLNYIRKNEKVIFIKNSAHCIPIFSDTLDVVIAVGLLQHIKYSRRTLDEFKRIVKPDGYIIINTLRQFSKFELLLIGFGSIFNINRFRLVWAIFKRDYFRGLVIDNTMVARRYSISEICKQLECNIKDIKVYYDGFLSTRFLSREITLVYKKKK